MAEKDIWLSHDERKLLELFACDMSGPKRGKTYELMDYMRLMKAIGYRTEDWVESRENIQICPYYNKVRDATKLLCERGLVQMRDSSMIGFPTISLTLEGWDLGKKYAHWFSCSQLWWLEYKRHWIIWGLGWIISLIVTSLITWWIAKA